MCWKYSNISQVDGYQNFSKIDHFLTIFRNELSSFQYRWAGKIISLYWTDMDHPTKEIPQQKNFSTQRKDFVYFPPPSKKTFFEHFFFFWARLKEPIFCLNKNLLYLPIKNNFSWLKKKFLILSWKKPPPSSKKINQRNLKENNFFM